MSSLTLIAVCLAVVAMLVVGALFSLVVLAVGLALVPVFVAITAAADAYHAWRRRRAALAELRPRTVATRPTRARHHRPHFGM